MKNNNDSWFAPAQTRSLAEVCARVYYLKTLTFLQFTVISILPFNDDSLSFFIILNAIQGSEVIQGRVAVKTVSISDVCDMN